MNEETAHADALLCELEVLIDDCGLDIDHDAVRGCIEHFLLVLEANRTINLTRITDVHEGLVLHILDSLLLTPFVESTPWGTLLDMGTGAGYPGVPLALATKRPIVLLDSVTKKITAVESFCQKLGIDGASCSNERVEQYAKEHRESCTCVVARAMASLPVLIEYASPLLSIGGSLIATKGAPESSEIDSGLKAARICGFEFETSQRITLPRGLGERTILQFKKTKPASIGLPRKVGVAKKTPLA